MDDLPHFQLHFSIKQFLRFLSSMFYVLVFFYGQFYVVETLAGTRWIPLMCVRVWFFFFLLDFSVKAHFEASDDIRKQGHLAVVWEIIPLFYARSSICLVDGSRSWNSLRCLRLTQFAGVWGWSWAHEVTPKAFVLRQSGGSPRPGPSPH